MTLKNVIWADNLNKSIKIPSIQDERLKSEISNE